jgi:hypothetical protein
MIDLVVGDPPGGLHGVGASVQNASSKACYWAFPLSLIHKIALFFIKNRG